MKTRRPTFIFFLDRTTATHPIEHYLVVRNSHHAAEANQSVSSPHEETFHDRCSLAT
jgi:hypothetical protein